MIKLLSILSCVQFALCGNVVEVLQQQNLTTLISLVQKAGLVDALLGGRIFRHYVLHVHVHVTSEFTTWPLLPVVNYSLTHINFKMLNDENGEIWWNRIWKSTDRSINITHCLVLLHIYNCTAKIFAVYWNELVFTTCLCQENLPFLPRQTKRLSGYRLQRYHTSQATHKLSPMCWSTTWYRELWWSQLHPTSYK